MRTDADRAYADVLRYVNDSGEILETRNHAVKRQTGIHSVFRSFPLITLRKTAWKKALREMEWFMSGEPTCPEELRDWWAGQLNPEGRYVGGYGDQMRGSSWNDSREVGSFDQVKFVIDALRNNPNGRRTIMTTWNPGEMAHITDANQNDKTPTCCHGTMTQFFVSQGKLNLLTFQRSADLLLGWSHNLVQYWALMQYFAHHSGLEAGHVQYILGDAHIYQDSTHQACVDAIVGHNKRPYGEWKGETLDGGPRLVYSYSDEVDFRGVPVFKASDFSVEGVVEPPLPGLPRPKLF